MYGDGHTAGRALLKALTLSPQDAGVLVSFGCYVYDWLDDDDLAVQNLFAAIRRGGACM